MGKTVRMGDAEEPQRPPRKPANQMPRASRTCAPGRSASSRPGSRSLEPRMPDPITTDSVFATAASTRTGQSPGSPIGVMPPYSIPVIAVTVSTGANDAFRASRCRRTSPFTSALVVAATMHAAYVVSAPRLAAITTQFADSSSVTPYRSQNAAVSASAGSMGATSMSVAPPGQARSAASTVSASRSGRSSAIPKSSTRPLWRAAGTRSEDPRRHHVLHVPGTREKQRHLAVPEDALVAVHGLRPPQHNHDVDLRELAAGAARRAVIDVIHPAADRLGAVPQAPFHVRQLVGTVAGDGETAGPDLRLVGAVVHGVGGAAVRVTRGWPGRGAAG